ncbi:hypothetical protein [uncultured Rikenella sp.]|uniref:hypothetical protein n=1 Tax=uncultured Rikenella sp. TaxID=368003 RepID=UPI0026281921|nr:hypothetical protein [uncultured Rikenella sp.]
MGLMMSWGNRARWGTDTNAKNIRLMRRNHFILVLSTVFAVLPGLSGFGRAAAQSFRADELADFASKESHVIR